ncbi:MAG: hypothetical protein FJX74_19200 [Armatimonadetes bacterium]|nr:hypothetical protein [Armatimonadota bacterium]
MLLHRRHGLTIGCALLALSLLAAGCGCGRRGGQYGGVDQLRQTRLSFAPETRKATCHVVAEVENTGTLPVREAMVTATLKSKGGTRRGSNNAFLKDVQPGEKRILYMTVTTHGSFHRVELSFHDPNQRNRSGDAKEAAGAE